MSKPLTWKNWVVLALLIGGGLWLGLWLQAKEAARWSNQTPEPWRGVYVTLKEDDDDGWNARERLTVYPTIIVREWWFEGEHTRKPLWLRSCRWNDGGFSADVHDGTRVQLEVTDPSGVYQVQFLDGDEDEGWHVTKRTMLRQRAFGPQLERVRQ